MVQTKRGGPSLDQTGAARLQHFLSDGADFQTIAVSWDSIEQKKKKKKREAAKPSWYHSGIEN